MEFSLLLAVAIRLPLVNPRNSADRLKKAECDRTASAISMAVVLEKKDTHA